MLLELLGLSDSQKEGGNVSILVGPNGSGKSSMLRDLAKYYKTSGHVVVVCNTPHDRFVGLRDLSKLSLGNIGHSPKAIVKKIIGQAANREDSTFFQINSTLEYCGYQPRFGLKIKPGPNYDTRYLGLKSGLGHLEDDLRLESSDLSTALDFIDQNDPGKMIWINTSVSAFEFSRAKDITALLRCENDLRRSKIVKKIDVFLERTNHDVIEIEQASSGQLGLISSLFFIIANADYGSTIIIDEPENSLHPSWQSEYIDKLLVALSYRDARIFVATHSPLIVTGALSDSSEPISVIQVKDFRPRLLELNTDNQASQSIEELLWSAFEVVTPANHFVSEHLVEAMSKLERGGLSKQSILELIDSFDNESFDPKQKKFFKAVRELANKVQASQEAGNNSVD